MILKVYLDDGAIMPTRAHHTDAGLDLYTPKAFFLKSRGSENINTGVHIEIPKGYVGLLKSKSGLNVKNSITGEGVIDAGYTGSMVVKLYNNDPDVTYHFDAGDKIIQLVLVPIITPDLEQVYDVSELYEGDTDRGNNGFGSSGK